MASRDASQKALNNIIKVIIIKKDNNDKNYRQNKPNRYYITTQYIFFGGPMRESNVIFLVLEVIVSLRIDRACLNAQLFELSLRTSINLTLSTPVYLFQHPFVLTKTNMEAV